MIIHEKIVNECHQPSHDKMVSSGSKCDRQGKKNPCACNLIPDTTNYGYQQKNNWADFYEFYHPILQYPTSGQANTAIPFPHYPNSICMYQISQQFHPIKNNHRATNTIARQLNQMKLAEAKPVIK